MVKPNKRTWIDIGSDVNWIDYGGRWARHIEGTRYHVIRFDNLEEHTGEVGAGYHCDLHEVDIDSPQLDDARRACGYHPDWCDDYGRPHGPLNKVEALSSYGAYAPLWQESGRNANRLIAAAKRESRRLQTDSEA